MSPEDQVAPTQRAPMCGLGPVCVRCGLPVHWSDVLFPFCTPLCMDDARAQAIRDEREQMARGRIRRAVAAFYAERAR